MSASNQGEAGEEGAASRPWLGARVLEHLRRITAPAASDAFDDSRLGLEARILATRTQIDALHRSLAMQKQALDATQRPRSSAAPIPLASQTYTQPLDLPLDEASESAYAETQPMPFIDLRPREAMGAGGLPENTGRK